MLAVGRSIELFKDDGRPGAGGAGAISLTNCGHALRRPYPDGDRVGRLAGPRASVHGRRGFLPGPQRVAVESLQLRRLLEDESLEFETDNDSEAACRLSAMADDAGRHYRTGADQRLREDRRLLHAADRHRAADRRWCATRSPASRRSSPRPIGTWRSLRSSAHWRICRASPRPISSSRCPSRFISWQVVA